MIVLREVAIVALHAFFEMDISEVDGFAETVGIVEGDLPAVLVQPVPFAVMIEHGTENPIMAVKIGEMRSLQLLVKFGTAYFLQKFFIDPYTTNVVLFRVPL